MPNVNVRVKTLQTLQQFADSYQVSVDDILKIQANSMLKSDLQKKGVTPSTLMLRPRALIKIPTQDGTVPTPLPIPPTPPPLPNTQANKPAGPTLADALASAPALAPTTEAYVVQEGDCMCSLAADPQNPVLTYRRLYDMQSGEYKRKRPNPNQLLQGDQIIRPKPSAADKKAQVTNVNQYQIAPEAVALRILLIDKDNKAFGEKPVTATIGSGAAQTVRTLGNGLLVFKKIPPLEKGGTLQIVLPAPPAPLPPLPPPPEDPNAPAYPPPLKVSDFKDKPDSDAIKQYMGAPDNNITLTLKIGAMPPYLEKDGVGARLENLGFTLSRGLEAAVKAYQTWLNKLNNTNNALTGKWEDIKDELRTRHDAL